ncbi:uncharacterized protein B0H64DRAFT_60783 [Chaetomium fimeti]|uniref:Uncharacterized protein n=1 Tax=Chaetomium fimeti TaxID=1854472 RepID=A0AAE0H5F0_9PEZI|nr:hypothetical protein B0H64DRAFT_60783 [Chaetomium fimeti]
MARQFRFVAVSNPAEPPSSKSKKLAYSHAFRQAHAQRRREETEKYRKERASVPVNRVFAASGEAISAPLSKVLNSNKDPFSSLARPLSSTEYFLLNHYVHVIVPFTVGHCGLFDRPGDHKTELLREWVGLAITDDTLMVAVILLSTCRYILQVQPSNLIIIRLALEYKQICLRTLLQEMSNTSTPVNTLTVAKAIALALDEVTAGEHAIAQKHLKGVLAMVNSRGGAGELGLTGLLERMYQRFMETLEMLQNGALNLTTIFFPSTLTPT